MYRNKSYCDRVFFGVGAFDEMFLSLSFVFPTANCGFWPEEGVRSGFTLTTGYVTKKDYWADEGAYRLSLYKTEVFFCANGKKVSFNGLKQNYYYYITFSVLLFKDTLN